MQVNTAEKRCVEKEQQLRDANEEMRLLKVSLSTKEGNYHSYYIDC